MIWVQIGAVLVFLMVIAIVIASFMRDDFSITETDDDDDHEEVLTRRRYAERPHEPLPRPRFRK